MAEAPTFAIRLGNQVYTGWTSISVIRDITRMSGEFTISLTRQNDMGVLPNISPGRTVAVEVDGKPILFGYIDAKTIGYDKARSDITINGRDKVGDLIDCAATVDGPFEYHGMPLAPAIRRIVKPYGISVRRDIADSAVIKRLAIQPGESAFEFIERACRAHKILPVSDGVGGLVLTRPGSAKSTGVLEYGNNILSGDVLVDATERYSLYVVKGQAETLDGNGDTEEIVSIEGRANDAEVGRYRPKVLVSENQGYGLTLKQRAEAERDAARAKSVRASYKVAGWYASGKTLWQPNTLVTVRDTHADINRDMLILGVEYNYSTEGTTARLELALPDAVKIEPNQGSDGASTLWVDDND